MSQSSSFFAALVIVLLGFPVGAISAVRTSTNYQIQNDVISSGGTENSTSANYSGNDTLGDISAPQSTSPNYKINAGYRSSIIANSISISSPSSVTLTPLSIAQSSAVGSVAWTIETSNAAGYQATINASGTPALRSTATSDAFADYGTTTRTTWSVSNSYKFGWSAFGSHAQGFGTGSSCTSTVNVPSTTLLWQGFNGATTYTYASSTVANPGGTAATVCFATERNGVFTPPSTYRADITVTAIAN